MQLVICSIIQITMLSVLSREKKNCYPTCLHRLKPPAFLLTGASETVRDSSLPCCPSRAGFQHSPLRFVQLAEPLWSGPPADGGLSAHLPASAAHSPVSGELSVTPQCHHIASFKAQVLKLADVKVLKYRQLLIFVFSPFVQSVLLSCFQFELLAFIESFFPFIFKLQLQRIIKSWSWVLVFCCCC